MIIVFVGKQGSGKSLSVVMAACKHLQAGRAVYANMSITDPVSGRSPERWDYLENGFDALLEVRDSLMVLDDAGTYLNSRDFQRRNSRRFFAMLAQARKRHNDLVLSCHDFDDLDVWMRRQCHEVVSCKAIRHPWQRDPSGAVHPLTGKPMRRLWYVRQTVVNPADATLSPDTRHKRRIRGHWRRLDSRYANAYDSWEEVGAAGTVAGEEVA